MSLFEEEVFRDPLAKGDDKVFDLGFDLGDPPKNTYGTGQPQQPQIGDYEPTYDPVEGPQPDPANEPVYRDYLAFKDNLGKVGSELTDFNYRSSSSNKRYDSFFDEKLPSIYSDLTGYEMPDNVSKANRKTLLEDLENQYSDAERKVLKGNENFLGLGEDEAFEQAKAFATPERKKLIGSLRKEHDRLELERDEYARRAYEKRMERDRMLEQRSQVPHIIRAEAEEWAKRERSLLASGTKKNKLSYSQIQQRLDARYRSVDPFGGMLDKSELSPSERVEARKALELLSWSKKETDSFRGQGGIVSNNGFVNGYPVGLTGAERETLEVADLKKAGITTYKGKPIEEALEALGGQEKVEALTAISSTLKLHNAYTNAGVELWSKWNQEGHEERQAEYDMAQSAIQRSLGNAGAMGLTNDIVRRNPSAWWFDHMLNASKRGWDRTDGTPRNIARIIAGDGGIDRSALSKIVEASQLERQSPRSKDYDNYMNALHNKGGSKGFYDAFLTLTDDKQWKGSAMTVLTEMMVESLASLIPLVANNIKDAGIPVVGASLLEFMLTKKPNKTAVKILGRNVGLAIKGSYGVASFQLGYIGKLLEDMSELGVDINNPDHMLSAWNNPEINERLRRRARNYAGGLAFFEMLGVGLMGRASKLLNGPTKFLGKTSLGKYALAPAIKSTAELGMDMGTGMASEYAGFVLSKDPGEKTPYDDILIEGAAELGPGIVSTGINFATPQLGDMWKSSTPRKPQDIVDDGTGNETQVLTDPVSDPNRSGVITSRQTYKGMEFEATSYVNPDAFNQNFAQDIQNATGVELDPNDQLAISSFVNNVIFRPDTTITPDRVDFVFGSLPDQAPGRYIDGGNGRVLIAIDPVRTKELGFTVAETFIHEGGHFAEDFILGEDEVKGFWDELTDEQKKRNALEYATISRPDGPATDVTQLDENEKYIYDYLLDNEKKNRSEWLSLQIARVLRGDIEKDGLPPGLWSAIQKVIMVFRSSIEKMFGSEDLAPNSKEAKAEMDQYLYEVLMEGKKARSGTEAVASPQTTATAPIPTATAQQPKIDDDAEFFDGKDGFINEEGRIQRNETVLSPKQQDAIKVRIKRGENPEKIIKWAVKGTQKPEGVVRAYVESVLKEGGIKKPKKASDPKPESEPKLGDAEKKQIDALAKQAVSAGISGKEYAKTIKEAFEEDGETLPKEFKDYANQAYRQARFDQNQSIDGEEFEPVQAETEPQAEPQAETKPKFKPLGNAEKNAIAKKVREGIKKGLSPKSITDDLLKKDTKNQYDPKEVRAYVIKVVDYDKKKASETPVTPDPPKETFKPFTNDTKNKLAPRIREGIKKGFSASQIADVFIKQSKGKYDPKEIKAYVQKVIDYDKNKSKPKTDPNKAKIIHNNASSVTGIRKIPGVDAYIVSELGRSYVVVDIDGVPITFYQSSGLGGKKETKAGGWYPTPGMDASSGWINKSTGKDMADYYGSEKLKKVAQELDSKIGDIRKVFPHKGFHVVHKDGVRTDSKKEGTSAGLSFDAYIKHINTGNPQENGVKVYEALNEMLASIGEDVYFYNVDGKVVTRPAWEASRAKPKTEPKKSETPKKPQPKPTLDTKKFTDLYDTEFKKDSKVPKSTIIQKILMDNVENIPAKDFADVEQALIRHSQQGQQEFDLSAPGSIIATLGDKKAQQVRGSVRGVLNFLEEFNVSVEEADDFLVDLSAKKIFVNFDPKNVTKLSSALAEPLATLISGTDLYREFSYDIVGKDKKGDVFLKEQTKRFHKFYKENFSEVPYDEWIRSRDGRATWYNFGRQVYKDMITGVLSGNILEGIAKQVDLPKSYIQKIKDFVKELFVKLSGVNTEELSKYLKGVTKDAFLGNTSPYVLKGSEIRNDISYDTVYNTDYALNAFKHAGDVVKKFTKDSRFALTGSLALASKGLVYRPKGEPVHDLDYTFDGSQEELVKAMEKLLPNALPRRAFKSSSGVMNAPYIIPEDGWSIKERKDGKLVWTNLKTGEVTLKGGAYITSDFFIQAVTDEETFNYNWKTRNGSLVPIKFTSPGVIFDAKLGYSRKKDIFDYQQYTENRDKLLSAKDRENKVGNLLKRSAFSDLSAPGGTPVREEFGVGGLANIRGSDFTKKSADTAEVMDHLTETFQEKLGDKNFEFTDGQKHAISDIADVFGLSMDGYSGKPSNKYVLKGYAGTGKTTMVQALMQMLEVQNSVNGGGAKFVWTGFTNNVANMGKSVFDSATLERRSGRFISGTSSSLFRSGKKDLEVSEKLKDYINESNEPIYVFVDETSLYPEPDIKKMVRYADHAFRTSEKDIRFVFLGDPGQIRSHYFSGKHNPLLKTDIPNTTLTEITRQSSGEILDFVTALRTLPEGNKSPAFPTSSKGQVQVYGRNKQRDFDTSLHNAFKSNPKSTVALSYRNVDVVNNNALARRAILGISEKDIPSDKLLKVLAKDLTDGERLNILETPQKDDLRKVEGLANGATFDVKNVRKQHGFDQNNGNSDFMLSLNKGGKVNLPASIYVADIYEPSNNKLVERDVPLLLIPASGKIKNGKKITNYASSARKITVNSNAPKAVVDRINQGDYVVATFGYGVTLHRSQGLQYDNVFVNGLNEDIRPNDKGSYRGGADDNSRLLYVGASRATKKLHIQIPAVPNNKNIHRQDTDLYTKTVGSKKIPTSYGWSWKQISNRVDYTHNEKYRNEPRDTSRFGPYDRENKDLSAPGGIFLPPGITPGSRPLSLDRNASKVTYTDKFSYMADLFQFADPNDPKFNNFLNSFVTDYVVPMAEQGRYFKYTSYAVKPASVNQFYINPMGSIETTPDLMEASFETYDDTPLRRRIYKRLTEGTTEKARQAMLDDMQRLRKGRILSLSLRNLAVSLMDPDFAQRDLPINSLKNEGLVPSLLDENIDVMNLQREDLRNHVKGYLNRLKQQKLSQDYKNSMLFHLKTLINAQISGKKSVLQSRSIKTLKLASYMLQRSSALDKEVFDAIGDADPKKSATENVAYFFDSLLDRNPNLPELDLKNLKVPNADKFNLTSGLALGSDSYFAELAEIFGLDITHFVESDKKGHAFKKKSWAHGSAVFPDLSNRSLLRAFENANSFYARAFQRDKSWDDKKNVLLKRNFYQIFPEVNNKGKINTKTKRQIIGAVPGFQKVDPKASEMMVNWKRGASLKRVPKGGTGWAVFYAIDAYYQKTKNFRIQRPDINIWDETTEQWYTFDFSLGDFVVSNGGAPVILEGRPVALIGTRGMYTGEDDYQKSRVLKLRTRSALEEVFIKTFPDQGNHLLNTQALRISLVENEDGSSYEFDVSTTDGRDPLSIKIIQLKKALDLLDSVPYTFLNDQKDPVEDSFVSASSSQLTVTNKLSTDSSIDPKNEANKTFSGATAQGGLPSKILGKNWSDVIRAVKRSNGTLNDNSVPTVIEIFREFPEMPWAFKSELEKDIAKIQNGSIAYEEKQIAKELERREKEGIKPAPKKKSEYPNVKDYFKANRPWENSQERISTHRNRIRHYQFTIEQILENIRLADVAIEHFSDKETLKKRLDTKLISNHLGRSDYQTPVFSAIMTKLNKVFGIASSQIGATLSNRYPRASGDSNLSTIDSEESAIDQSFQRLQRLTGMTSMMHSTEIEDAWAEQHGKQEEWGFTPSTDGKKDIESFGGLAGEGSGMPLKDAQDSARAMNLERSSRDFKKKPDGWKNEGGFGQEAITKIMESATSPEEVQAYVEMLLERGVWYEVVPSMPTKDGKQLYQVQQIHTLWDHGKNADWIDSQYETWVGMSESGQKNYFTKLAKDKTLEKPFVNWLKNHFNLRKKIRDTAQFDKHGPIDPKTGQNTLRPISLSEINKLFKENTQRLTKHVISNIESKELRAIIAEIVSLREKLPEYSLVSDGTHDQIIRQAKKKGQLGAISARIKALEKRYDRLLTQETDWKTNPNFKAPPQIEFVPGYIAPTEDAIARFIQKVNARAEKEKLGSWLQIQALMEKGIPGGVESDRAFDLALVRNVYFLFGEEKVKELLNNGLRDFRTSRGHNQTLIDHEANKSKRNTLSPSRERQATSNRAPGADERGRYDEQVARVKFYNWAFREELDAVGIEPREYDEVLDKRYYFKNLDSDKLEWDASTENPVEEYFQATMALSNFVHSTNYVTPEFLDKLGIPQEILGTGYKKVGSIVEAFETVTQSSDLTGYEMSPEARTMMSTVESLRDRLYKAKEALNVSGVDGRSGFYISPRLLANALWNSGESVARQVYPDYKRDQRGELMKSFNEVGLSAFQKDNELANFISRDMAGLPQGFITDEIVGIPQSLEEMTGGTNPKMSFDQFVHKYGKPKLLKKAREEIAKLRFMTKGSSSANTSNAVLVNGGAFTERVRMNNIPAEVYIDMMLTLIKSNPNMFLQDVNSSNNIGARVGVNKDLSLGMLNQLILASFIQPSTTDSKAMSYKMFPDQNVTGKSTTTAQLIIDGKRTATTRTEALGKPGELIRISGVPGVFRVTGVEQITKAKSIDKDFVAEWSRKEGWTTEFFQKNIGDLEGKTQTTFEPISNYWDIFKNKDGRWNNSLLQLGFILMYDRQGGLNLKELNEGEFRGSESADFQFLGAGGKTTVDPALLDQIVMKGAEAMQNDLVNPDVVNQRNTQEDVIDTDLDTMDLSAPGAFRQSFDKWVTQDIIKGDPQNRERAREKFRENEIDRRDVVGRIRHGFHKRIVNSYYELEEMVELMMIDLKKANPTMSQSDIDKLKVDQRIRTYNGKTGVALDNAKSTYEMPFMDKVSDINDPDPLKLVGDYWYARYAKTRNNNIYRKRAKSGISLGNHYGADYGSGMNNSTADQILFKVQNHPDFKKIQDITKDFDKMNQDTLKVLVQGGVLPQRQYDSIVHDAVDENGNWVWAPLRGFEKDYAEDYPTGLDGIIDSVDSSVLEKGAGTGSGFSQTKGQYALAHAFGRTNMANSYEIWGNAFKAHSEAIVRANKNTETAQSLLSLLTEISNNKETYSDWNNVFEIIDSRDPKFKDRFPSKIVPFLSSDSRFSSMGLPEYETTQLKEVRANELDLDLNNEIFTVRVEGEPVYIRFKGEVGRNIVTSLKGSENAKLGPFLKTMRGISGFFSAVYTVWNVSFIFSNAIRDIMSASLNLGSSESTRTVANKVLDMRSLFRNAQVMYKLSRERRVGGLTTGILNDTDKAFYKRVSKQLMVDRNSVSESDLNKLLNSVEMTSLLFQDAGGQIEFYGMEDVETKTQDIFNSIQKLQTQGSNRKADANLFKSFVSLINDMNTGVENATRVQAFKVLLQGGASVQESAFKGGREGTVDFTRKGTWTNYFNAFFPFFGAGIAGNARMVRALFYGSEGESKSAKAKLAKSIIGFGFLYSLLARTYAGEDEETEEQHWDRLSDFQKSHNINIFTKTGGVGEHFSIPLPYGWNILYGLGARGADVAMSTAGKTDREYGVMEASAGVASMLVDTFHPMSGGHGITKFIPHLPRGFVEISEEKNFLGNPIMPGQSPYGAEKPDHQRYWSTVNPISKDSTRLINRITGGDDFVSGIIDISPESVDHAINYYTGTMGRNLWGIAGMMYDGSNTNKVGKYKTLPVVPRLFKLETDDYSTEGRFLDLQKEVKVRTNRIKKLEERGNRAEASQFKRLDSDYIRIQKLLSRYQSRVSFTARKIAELRRKKTSPEKLQQLESKLKSARIKDMALILKKARQLGIST